MDAPTDLSNTLMHMRKMVNTFGGAIIIALVIVSLVIITNTIRALSLIHISTALDQEWTQKRGMIIESVGIQSISYDENSKKLIERRNEGAMLSDPGIREGYVQGAVARGMEAAGSNQNGAMMGFAGLGVGMQTGGGFVGAASAANQNQAEDVYKRQAFAGPGA